MNIRKSHDFYDAFECEFVLKTGTSYPEGGHGEEDRLDLCKKCSEEAKALLENNGYKIQSKEWDW